MSYITSEELRESIAKLLREAGAEVTEQETFVRATAEDPKAALAKFRASLDGTGLREETAAVTENEGRVTVLDQIDRQATVVITRA